MKILKKIPIFIIFVLILINISFYINSINLSNELYNLEREIDKLNIENKEIEKKITKINSLVFLASKAAALGLKHEAKFMSLEPEKYALSK